VIARRRGFGRSPRGPNKGKSRAVAGAGSVAEWSIAPVLKTGNGKPFVSSNLTASAKGDRRESRSIPPHRRA
jgi:hypothetical protein